MDPHQLIAHRGLWWPRRQEENSLGAIERAFHAGFGVEVDVRRAPDQSYLVLSHDVPASNQVLATWDDFLVLAARVAGTSFLLINIKDPGTEFEVAWTLKAYGLDHHSFVFDFELCGADPTPCLRQGISCLKRVSDRQEELSHPAGPSWYAGFWIDQWDSDWVDAQALDTIDNLPTFLVAPDLHGRMFDFARVAEWETATGICTDIPHLLWELKTNSALTPNTPWWNP